MKPATYILPVIVLAQFCCTALWFAGNAVMDDLVRAFSLSPDALAHLTSAVQFGFICGTLLFALTNIADRFSPSGVFCYCAIAGAFFNLFVVLDINNRLSLVGLRFLTGFTLAGIYPVGMKIAADYFDKGLGKSLGYLVGALVLGTAFPHLLKGFTGALPWRTVLYATSALAVFGGGLIIILIPDGPNRKAGTAIDLSAFFHVFKNQPFRAAAFGYFGHMWELYAFWAFVPLALTTYTEFHPAAEINIPAWSFIIIGAGGIACVLGGYLSQWMGTKTTAASALACSGLCCLLSPLLFMTEMPYLFLIFLTFWGMVVVADSPLFSTLVAQNAPQESKGTALTIVNCLGFTITIFSIQLVNVLQTQWQPQYLFVILVFGPALGLLALLKRT